METEQNSLEKIINVDVEKEMKKSFMEYSMSVIVSRALPDVRDGLKPVHRRILYSQYEENLTPEKPYRKCANTVGDVLGRYHPHGDSSVYEALVRLAQDFSMRYPLVDGHGNFGSIDGDPPAAYRYTESKMSKMSVEMLTDIDKETVDFMPNYDDTRKEPTVLPSRFPNLLVNGSTGIAVGMATNIPPHNMGEVIDAVCCVIDNPDAGLEELMTYVKGPDFPTAGIVMGQAGIRAAYATGRGKILVRARAEIVEDKNRFKIIITELPYQVNKARLVESIADMVKDKKIEGISNIEDHSDRNGMHVEITLKREAAPQIILNKLFTYSQMQITYGIIMLAIVNGEPKILSLKEILQHYIDFQVEVVTRRTRFDLKKAEERANILEGLKIAIDFIDEVIAIIRSSKDQQTARNNLSERFGLNEAQTQAIVSMRLGQLSGLERIKIEEELLGIKNKIAEYKELLQSHEKMLGQIKTELVEMKRKYNDDRRTEIMPISGEVDIEDLIPNEQCVVTLTNLGYIKRQKSDEYALQNKGGKGKIGMTQRDEDATQDIVVLNTHEYLLFFTNLGKVYRLKCYEIPEGSRSAKGMNINNLLPLATGEKVTSIIKVIPDGDDNCLVMITRKGLIKRTLKNEFNTTRKGGVIAIGLREDDELAWVRLTNGHSELIVATHNGMSIRFAETDVRTMGRSASGVKAITLREDDYVVGMSIVRENAKILTVSETGYGRISELSDYRMQSRGGYGTINYHTEKYGKVAAIKSVDMDDDIILMTDNGVIIRIAASSVRICSRPSKGVRVMRVDESNRIVSLARVPHNSEEDDEIPLEEDTEVSSDEDVLSTEE